MGELINQPQCQKISSQQSPYPYKNKHDYLKYDEKSFTQELNSLTESIDVLLLLMGNHHIPHFLKISFRTEQTSWNNNKVGNSTFFFLIF